MSQIEEFDSKVHQMRQVKVEPHLRQYAPVWIIEEKLIPEDSSIQFNVLFQHNIYGWVNRRYRYDGFNDVLYHKGQTLMDEDDALDILEDREPFIDTDVADTRNAYGG
jgi:hypothetical protein